MGDQYYGEIKAQLSAKRLYIKINVEQSEPPEKKAGEWWSEVLGALSNCSVTVIRMLRLTDFLLLKTN